MIFALTEVLRAEKLLRANDLGSFFRGGFGLSKGVFQIRSGIGQATRLEQTDFNDGRRGLHVDVENPLTPALSPKGERETKKDSSLCRLIGQQDCFDDRCLGRGGRRIMLQGE